MVTLIPEWPIMSCTTVGCSPPTSISVAKLWRRAWNGMYGSPALEQRLEGTAEDVVAIEGRAYQRGKHESVIWPETIVL